MIKLSIGLVILVFVFSSTGIQTAIKTISLINAGRYIALPESMAWQCVDTIDKSHYRKLQRIIKLDIDRVIKQQMIDFEQADYKRSLKAACDIDDLAKLPDPDTLMEIKP